LVARASIQVLALALPATDEARAVLYLGAGALALSLLLLLVQALGRGRRRSELQEIVETVDDLRSGISGRHADVPASSPFAPLAEAVNRLADGAAAARADRDLSREGLDAVLEAAPEYVVLATDGDGDVRSCRGAAFALFGWEPQAIVGRPASALFEEGSWKELLPKLARRELREAGIATRAVMAGSGGRRFEADVTVRQVREGADDGPGFLVVIRDVTGSAHLAARLAEAEGRYTSLVEGLKEGIAVLRRARILYSNSALATMCGSTVADLSGTLLRDHVATPDVLLLQDTLTALESKPPGEVARLRLTLVDRAGEPRAEVTLTATAILHESGPAVLASIADETAEKRAEEELRRNAARLDSLLEAASDGLLVLERTAAGPFVRLTNRAFTEMSGVERGRILGATEAELIESLRAAGARGEAVATFLATSTSATRRDTVLVSEDSGRTLELNLFPLGGTGGAEGRVLTCRDVTDQKEFERTLEANNRRLTESKASLEESYRELQSVHDALARRSQELDRLNGELKTLDQMKSDLLANVSHELQTPLVSIRGYTEMVLKGRLGAITEEQRKGLTLSLTNVDRLIAMIDNLLAFARMDRELGEIRIATFALSPLVEEAVELVREKLQEKHVGIATTFEERSVAVRADREKILQVFLNLITNGIKFNREGGRIEIAVRRAKPGFVAVEVRDTGVGIPESDLEKVFDRFYRVGGKAGAEQGTGLGLSIVRNILRLHGCVIQAQSRPGEGSTFTFTLPAADADARTETSAAAAPDERPAPEEAPEAPRPRFRIIRPPDSSS
jgi:PAS domain S-box-containing protein